MSKLNLVPNEVKGYRIRPNQWNWTVVVIKVHGKDSKNAGQEYETPMAYCKDVPSAITYIMRTVGALEGRKEQDEVFDTTGVIADLEALKKAFITAQNFALEAVKELEQKVLDRGFTMKEVQKNLSKPVEEIDVIE